MQIRTRLTLQFILIVASIMLVAMMYIYFQVKSHLLEEFYNSLRSKANLTAAVAIARIESDSLMEIGSTSADRFTVFTENMSIYDASDRLVYTFHPAPRGFQIDVLSDIRNYGEKSFISGPFNAIGQNFVSSSGKKYVIIAEALFNDEDLDALLRFLALIFTVLIVVVALGGYIFSRQALAPINHIMNDVDDILPTDLSQRLFTENKKDELSRLVITFNKLLDRIQGAFNAQKQFLSNISHELKNPLTVVMTQLEIALQKDRTSEEYKQAMQSVLEDMKELNDVSDNLMLLARIDSGQADENQVLVRVDELIWSAKDLIYKRNPEYRVMFKIANLPKSEDVLNVNGNEHLLRTALINLMDNGCKFSPDKQVLVRLAVIEDRYPVIEIEDHGPGIPEAEQALVFNPFFRSAGTASAKGSGIGLSLVSSIMRMHQIDLKMENLTPNGTRFRLTFLPASYNLQS
ncbi:MAG: hypothetical protein KA479_09100 [Saprospiraceae bacterium]|nr:hypothetical protein [Saprospiraceae bacterium]